MCLSSSSAQEILLTDRQCVEFLQWALPQLGLRWPGFRKVRGQVRKRIIRRMRELEFTHIAEYHRYLADHPAEWTVLDACLRISISRFYRDRDVFEHLRDSVLPDLARTASQQGERRLKVWSAGCASGEEPYTIALIWSIHVQPGFPELELHVLATDADETMLQRAERARYPASSLKDVPADWKQNAFVCRDDEYQLVPQFRSLVQFRLSDIRQAIPAGSFSLILCRNLVFTYFDEPQQRQVLARTSERLIPGGCLVIGKHESLPATTGLIPDPARLGFFRAG